MKFKTGRALAAVALAGSFVVAVLPSVSSASSTALSPASFTSNYSLMFSKTIQNVVHSMPGWTAAGGTKLDIGVILPDEVTSTRYVEFDAPNLTTAFTDAGLSPAEYNVQNAQGSDATEITDAQADITNGAKVLLMDPLDATTGAAIEAAAAKAGVKVIDYDRLTLNGSRQYYVSFNNVAVGTLIGKGLTACFTAWKIKKPTVWFQARRRQAEQREHHQREHRYVGSVDGTDRLPGRLLGSPEDRRSGDAERRECRADHRLPAGQGSEAEQDSLHRPGRNLDRFPQHPRGLPVRHRLQADLA